MTFTAFWLILFSVILHVSWNLISKASKISAAFYIITSLAAGTVSLPFLFCAGIAWEKLPAEFFGCGGVAHFENFQSKLRTLLRYGFPHHMSLSYGDNFTAVEEAFYSYLNYSMLTF